jgi:membrane associated rhomboid family serine protease
MFPIRDHNPSEKIPFVTYTLIAVNVAVFQSYWGQMENARYINAFFDTYAFTPRNLTQNDEALGLFTSMYLHGGLMHLFGNMLFLWIFGDNMEEAFGHVGFFMFYTVSGVAATLAHYAAAPMSNVPLVGASGAIAGVMGGYLLLFPRAKVDILFILLIFIRIFSVPAWVILGVWFGLQLLNGSGGAADGVAYWAHAGGFIVGFVLTLPLWLKRGAQRFWQRHHGQPPHPEADYRWQNSRVPSVRRGQRSGTRVPIVRRRK